MQELGLAWVPVAEASGRPRRLLGHNRPGRAEPVDAHAVTAEQIAESGRAAKDADE
jgi:hypothetical protein